MAKKTAVKFDVPPLTPEQLRDAIVQIPNLPVMYFNHARVATSNFDVRVFFGQMNITAQNKQSVTEQLCVVFTAEFTKVFLEALRTALERYEGLFGKIRQMPTGLAILPGPEAKSTTQSKRNKRVN